MAGRGVASASGNGSTAVAPKVPTLGVNLLGVPLRACLTWDDPRELPYPPRA